AIVRFVKMLLPFSSPLRHCPLTLPASSPAPLCRRHYSCRCCFPTVTKKGAAKEVVAIDGNHAGKVVLFE
ncbi:hypothetical protein, partial [Paenibacillus cisolokensis]|uniref:hypothetical protein n=1 Tax=Paenibacillus cisolokensis TaxID=1658519 RepID=UPI001BCAD3DF